MPKTQPSLWRCVMYSQTLQVLSGKDATAWWKATYNEDPGVEFQGLIIDNFAGGGGASTGLEMALGKPVDIAINHDPAALAMHDINHPKTQHFIEDVWAVDPRIACKGKPVGVAWFSPDCKHFSKAKGNKPKNKNIRGLAWVAMRWAATVKPRIIFLENVQEFLDWGPLLKNGKPDPKHKGRTFKNFVKELKRKGYTVEWRVLSACDYGAPTIRKRFFLIARCDGMPIVWPAPTHGEGLLPYKTTRECIEWDVPGTSIFNRKRPLVEKTMQRITKGLRKYANCSLNNGEISFITEHANGSSQRNFSLDKPMNTLCAEVKGGHFAIVTAFVVKYYGQRDNIVSLDEPMHTLTTKDRFALITVHGTKYKITDIKTRMFTARECYSGQGFHKDYIIDFDYNGKPFTKEQKIQKCGNSVSPYMAYVLARANTANSNQLQKVA